jgi:tetratricopeptide (TPR) repeat protein
MFPNTYTYSERGTDCDPVDENFNEALRLARSGNFKDAEQSIQKALDLDLEGRREKMICSIPDQEALAMDRKTFAMMDQMALILAFGGYDDKDYDRAKKFNDSAYKACLERFGEEDPGTLCTIYHKALILGYYKKYKEAEKSIQKACNGQKSRLGEDHPDTLHSMYYRALVLEQNGKITEAQEVYKKALGGCKEDCEKKHPQPGSGVRVHQLMETIEKKITS